MPHSPSGLYVTERPPLDDGPAQGRLVVLVHGTMDRATSFNRLSARLGDATVVAYDRRGYGRSGHVGADRSFDRQTDDLLEVLAGRPAVAVGHSFGGDVVLAVMDRQPGLITAAVVWEPPQPWLAWWPGDSASRGAGADLDPAERAEWFMRRMVGDRVWERLPAATRQQRRAEGVALTAEMEALGEGAPFDVARIRAPVLVGRGGRSRVHQRRSARELAAALPAGELVEIAGADHGAHLSHPAEMATLLRRVAGWLPGG